MDLRLPLILFIRIAFKKQREFSMKKFTTPLTV